MIVFSVFYPATGGARFDAAYYNATHIPLVEQAFKSTGLAGVQVFHGSLPETAGLRPTWPWLISASKALRPCRPARPGRVRPRSSATSPISPPSSP